MHRNASRRQHDDKGHFCPSAASPGDLVKKDSSRVCSGLARNGVTVELVGELRSLHAAAFQEAAERARFSHAEVSQDTA